MRVIAGRAKGHRLKMVPGETTRPITDRVKENLFNILGTWVVGSRWLDLFAGTGQVGIEALSRGAARTVFIDNSISAVRTIRENLQHTRLEQNAYVMRQDAFKYLHIETAEKYDVIYVAPPQYQGIWRNVLEVIDQEPSRYLSNVGMVIIQIDPKEYEDLELKRLNLFDQRRYGNTMLCFYEFDG